MRSHKLSVADPAGGHQTAGVVSDLPPLQPVADLGSFYAVSMAIAAWLQVADHPRHRDVVRHAKKAHWDFARRAQGPMLETLRCVVAGEVDGKLCKVDGHTRSHLWRTHQLPWPENVFVTVYRCESEAELHDLYNAFDSQFAVEERYESVVGAYHAHQLNLTSKRLRDGMVVDALYIALTGVARSNQKVLDVNELDIYRAVGWFREELQLLDSAKPRAEVFHGGVVAAALLGLSLRPAGLRFFKELSRAGRRQGSTAALADGKRDPVAATLLHLHELKQSRIAWVKRRQEDLCARTLTAFFAHLHGTDSPGYWFDDVPAPMEFRSVIDTVRGIKGIPGLEPTK